MEKKNQLKWPPLILMLYTVHNPIWILHNLKNEQMLLSFKNKMENILVVVTIKGSKMEYVYFVLKLRRSCWKMTVRVS